MIVVFHGLEIQLPPNWVDVTDDLPDGSPPTLARQSGVGALQFSIARYRGGDAPSVSPSDLRGLLQVFCHRHGFDFRPDAEQRGNIHIVKSQTVTENEIVSIWYASNGMDVVLATYVAERNGSDEAKAEQIDADNIIESLRF